MIDLSELQRQPALNVGAPVKVTATKNTLAERILSEEAVQKMLALEPSNRALLRLLYAAGSG